MLSAELVSYMVSITILEAFLRVPSLHRYQNRKKVDTRISKSNKFHSHLLFFSPHKHKHTAIRFTGPILWHTESSRQGETRTQCKKVKSEKSRGKKTNKINKFIEDNITEYCTSKILFTSNLRNVFESEM